MQVRQSMMVDSATPWAKYMLQDNRQFIIEGTISATCCHQNTKETAENMRIPEYILKRGWP